MMRILVLSCAALVFSVSAAFAEGTNTPDPEIARQMGYRTLANGAIVYEEIPGMSGDLEDIAPAAGGSESANPQAPEFRYDPLTQTYRRIVVDKQGNTAQDVINTNKK